MGVHVHRAAPRRGGRGGGWGVNGFGGGGGKGGAGGDGGYGGGLGGEGGSLRSDLREWTAVATEKGSLAKRKEARRR